jgi:hypothetical protein
MAVQVIDSTVKATAAIFILSDEGFLHNGADTYRRFGEFFPFISRSEPTPEWVLFLRAHRAGPGDKRIHDDDAMGFRLLTDDELAPLSLRPFALSQDAGSNPEIILGPHFT